MTEAILLILGLLWLFITLGLSCAITMNIKDDNYKSGCLESLKEYIEELFIGRNLFGFLLSIIIFIIAIPTILLIVLMQLLIWITCGMVYVWKLGYRK